MQLKRLCYFVLSYVLSINAQNSCGISGKSTGFIVNGTASQRGAWPWIASLHKAKGDKFYCGGTLISTNVVVTVSCEYYYQVHVHDFFQHVGCTLYSG